MGPKRGLEGARAYRENSPKHDISKSDSEKILFRKFYVGRGGSKEPPGGFILTVLPPSQSNGFPSKNQQNSIFQRETFQTTTFLAKAVRKNRRTTDNPAKGMGKFGNYVHTTTQGPLLHGGAHGEGFEKWFVCTGGTFTHTQNSG
jgi:hypothetical protein